MLGIGLHLVVHATGAIAVKRREIIRALGAGLVAEDVIDIEDRRIEHLLLGDDRDGGAEVLELRVEARAGEGVEGLVAPVGVGRDLEGGEHHRFLGESRARAGTGRRLGGGGGLGGEVSGEEQNGNGGAGAPRESGSGRVGWHGRD